MNAKLYTILVFALLATAIFATASVLAQETSSETASDTAIASEVNDKLDGSVSGLKIGWENFKLWFTFNNEKKAMQELKIARLRLIQAKIAAKNGDTEAMQNALEAHNKILEKIQERINAIDGASDKEGTKLAATKLVGLERAIEVHEARISKLNELLASENLTDEQRAKLENKIAKAENNTAHLREVEADKKEKITTRLRAVGNMTKEEADSAIKNLEDAQNLSKVKEMVAELKLKHQEGIAEKIKERIANKQGKK